MANRTIVTPLPLSGAPRAGGLAERLAGRVSTVGTGLLWNLASLALALSVWQLVCLTLAPDFPTPLASFRELVALLADPWSADMNRVGIARQVAASLGRVLIGFGLSALVAIPVGIAIGVNPVCRKLFDPIVQMLRPVSPLVWFPLSLVAFKTLGGISSATLFTIFVTSLWPTLVNTAFGVSSLPEDYRTVSRVFQFSPLRFLNRVLLPFAFPHILTGLRLSMGNAWLVIVAAEMLSGDTGIGFFAWDSYNAGSYERMIVAVIAIGTVGLAIDRTFAALHARFDYAGATR
jgi:nitrate/nitrite transport system permease protein